jgi:hypothetical protein
MQHLLLADILGYQYVPGMDQALMVTDPQEQKTCLDLGTRSGAWYVLFKNVLSHLIQCV